VDNVSARRVRVIEDDGDGQMVRIPREFALPGGDVLVRQDGPRLIIEPVRNLGLKALIASWDAINDEWPEIDDPVPTPVDVL
jgi:antitoxin VapB